MGAVRNSTTANCFPAWCWPRKSVTSHRHGSRRWVEVIENDLRSRNVTEVPAREIGQIAMGLLREIDEIAYVRFASVYRSFKDVEQMRASLEEMLNRPPGTRAEPARRKRRQGRVDPRELALDLADPDGK